MNTKFLILVAFILLFAESNAQLSSYNDNSEYGIAQKISDKAKQRNLGKVHSESAKTVSYTHLDVYKRQYQDYADIRSLAQYKNYRQWNWQKSFRKT